MEEWGATRGRGREGGGAGGVGGIGDYKGRRAEPERDGDEGCGGVGRNAGPGG